MRFAVACVAFAASLFAFLLLVAAGLFLAGIEQSGARGAGVLAAFGALLAFAAAGFLVFAPAAYFSGSGRRPLGLTATFLACAPTALLAFGAFSFAGIPFGGQAALMDWSIFLGGVFFALGSASILFLGYLRLLERPRADRSDDEEVRVRRA